jgi:hypothetical protein
MAKDLIIPVVSAVIEKHLILELQKRVQKNEAITSINAHQTG